MSTLEIVAVVLVVLLVLLVLSWHLSYTAARLHRLHTRVEGTLAALDAALVRRAEAALEVANAAVLDPASSFVVADAATACLDASPEGFDARDWVEAPLAQREALEDDLTRALRTALAGREPSAGDRPGADDSSDDPADALLTRLDDAHRRAGLAHSFHHEAVADVRWLRRRVTVRIFRLAGHADLPRPVALTGVSTPLRGPADEDVIDPEEAGRRPGPQS